jgi:hypothetical protein
VMRVRVRVRVMVGVDVVRDTPVVAVTAVARGYVLTIRQEKIRQRWC